MSIIKNNCLHKLKIVNFDQCAAVSYPIIKIIGLIEPLECSSEQNHVTLILNSKPLDTKALVSNNKFKVFVELTEGQNDLILTYCCQSLNLTVTYNFSNSTYSVIPLYVICDGHDGKFQAPSSEVNDIESACKRITLCSKLLQCFTAEKLYENGMGRKTFCLKSDCKVFRSKLSYLEARKMSQEKLWECIGREIMNSNLGLEQVKYLAFLSCTFYNSVKFAKSMKTHKEFVQITEGYVALGGGGLALFGTACFYTWPENLSEVSSKFANGTLVDRTKFLDDSCYRGTVGACFSTTLGSVLHELYHTFNLGHTEVGIMGRGFDNIYKFFTTNLDEVSRDTSKNFQTQIEFEEEFEAEKLSERLQKEYKKKSFNIIRKFEEDDDTFLTRSCTVILCYHKWFNSPSADQIYTLSYDPSNKFIKSTTGIRVVEVRRESDELVQFSWTFEGKVIKYSFQLPDEIFVKETKFVLFVEDSNGNILKEIVQ